MSTLVVALPMLPRPMWARTRPVRAMVSCATTALAPAVPSLPEKAKIRWLTPELSIMTESGMPNDPPLAAQGAGVPVRPGGLVVVQPPPPIITGPALRVGLPPPALMTQSSPSWSPTKRRPLGKSYTGPFGLAAAPPVPATGRLKVQSTVGLVLRAQLKTQLIR